METSILLERKGWLTELQQVTIRLAARPPGWWRGR
jgi:hypothetical protein